MLDLVLALAYAVPLLIVLVVLARLAAARSTRFWSAALLSTAVISLLAGALVEAYSRAPASDVVSALAAVVVAPVVGSFSVARFSARRSNSRGLVAASVAYFGLLFCGFAAAISLGLVR
jgi:hypothetical protein